MLDNLSAHLKDEKLHVVAAPGAGKTILGIEVIARLKKPVLIFAPTLTIRNQWKERIVESFMDNTERDIISLDIKNPKQITITTYQSLWSVFSNKKELPDEEDITSSGKIVNSLADEIVKKLKKQKVSFGNIINFIPNQKIHFMPFRICISFGLLSSTKIVL